MLNTTQCGNGSENNSTATKKENIAAMAYDRLSKAVKVTRGGWEGRGGRRWLGGNENTTTAKIVEISAEINICQR